LKSHRHRFDCVVGRAKALTIVDIKGLATVLKLDDMVGMHAVLGPCLAAPVPILKRLAPTAGTGHHLSTPGLELGAVVDWVNAPR
jgi:hypothetical protein